MAAVRTVVDCNVLVLFGTSEAGCFREVATLHSDQASCTGVYVIADVTSSLSHPSLHPTLPILATGSGQRKFPLPHLCTESGSEDSENESGNEDDLSCENSLKLWVFQQSSARSTLTTESVQCSDLELSAS